MMTTKAPPQETIHRPEPGDRDANLAARGYCAKIDDSGRRRCYRAAGHAGDCVFGTTFQLVHRPR